MVRTNLKKPIKFTQDEEASEYNVASESLSVKEKLKILEQLGRPELIETFKDWTPRQARAPKKSAPLDQRVSITVTDKERIDLQHDIQEINKTRTKTNVSAFVRNRALGSVDINGWKELAENALEEVDEIEKTRGQLVRRERKIKLLIENEKDPEQIGLYEIQLTDINQKLGKIITKNESRKNRLSGRMTMVEAETVKWRAARLSISTSDYLRFVIFNLLPGSGDAHMSIDAKKRFWISIIEVAENGWGDPPTIAHCTQCISYINQIRKLQERVNQLETYL
jgi:hypothetical protein